VKYLVVYDITEDDVRNKVRNTLKDYGGNRIQYSAFVFDKSEIEMIQIMLKIKKIIGNTKGKVIAIPICARDIDKVVTIAYKYELPEEDSVIV